VCRYLAAAEVHANLSTLPGVPLPECEWQVRPLIGLATELAQQAWLQALGSCPNGQVTARHVKQAVRQVLKSDPSAAPVPGPNRQQRYEGRRAVRQGFDELITLLLKRAEPEVLLGKVQALQRLVTTILSPKKRQA
jgi:hypothetical protein